MGTLASRMCSTAGTALGRTGGPSSALNLSVAFGESDAHARAVPLFPDHFERGCRLLPDRPSDRDRFYPGWLLDETRQLIPGSILQRVPRHGHLTVMTSSRLVPTVRAHLQE